MKMTQRFTVLGARHFNDSIEGQKHDFTKLRVQMDVPDSSKTEVGKNVSEMVWGDHENFSKIKHLPFPVEMELTVNATTKGFEVLDCKPISAVQGSAAQPKAA
jgi:hypothetical protein